MIKKLTVTAVLLCLLSIPAQAATYTSLMPFIPDLSNSNVGTNFSRGGVSIFVDEVSFVDAASAVGKQLKFVEDFEEGNVGAGGIASLMPPLAPGVPNVDDFGLGYPNGLAATNIQMNTGTGDLLVVLGDGFAGNVTTVVGANSFADSTVIEVLSGPKTAIGMNVYDPIGGTGDFDLTVLDPSGGLLFDGVVSPGATSGSFLGIVTPQGSSIGSIELAAAADGGELLDNIQLWVPEPTSASMVILGVFGLFATRRR